MRKELPKIIVILGSTASGKTDLGLKLAKKFNGEVVSADSRQVYKKMDIGTAKPQGVWEKINGNKVYVVDNVPHHLVDIVDPGENFTVADYKKMATEKINDILSKGKLPIIVGGTGLYIWTLLDNLDIPKIKPSQRLRKGLEKKSLPELVAFLIKLDPETARRIDLHNPRRVLRALEVFILSGESLARQRTKSAPLFNALQIGIDLPRAELYKRIDARIDQQIKNGLVEETKKLVKQKYDWSLPSMSGIGYKQIGFYLSRLGGDLRGEAALDEAIAILKRDTRRYAKRQMTWFKRDKKINWLKKSDFKLTAGLVKKFLAKPGFVSQEV